MRSLAILLVLASPAAAGHKAVVRQQVVVVPQGFVILNYAVPVGIPSYVQYQAVPNCLPAPQASAASSTAGSAGQDAPAAQSVKPSLIVQHCAKCHTGDKPKGGVSFTESGSDLAADVRLRAIRQVIQGKMPKGKQLDPQTRADLIDALSQIDEPEEPTPEGDPAP